MTTTVALLEVMAMAEKKLKVNEELKAATIAYLESLARLRWVAPKSDAAELKVLTENDFKYDEDMFVNLDGSMSPKPDSWPYVRDINFVYLMTDSCYEKFEVLAMEAKREAGLEQDDVDVCPKVTAQVDLDRERHALINAAEYLTDVSLLHIFNQRHSHDVLKGAVEAVCVVVLKQCEDIDRDAIMSAPGRIESNGS